MLLDEQRVANPNGPHDELCLTVLDTHRRVDTE